MKKRGLILIPFLTGYGGTETVIKNLLTSYNKNKNECNIQLKLYSLGGYVNGDWLHFPNVKVFQFPKNRKLREFLYLFTLPFLIFYLIFKEKPNFIISTNPIIWTIAKIESELIHKNIKMIAWYHYSYIRKPVNKYFLNKPDYFFTISKSGKKELESLGIKPDQIFVIYNPVIPTKKIIRRSKNHNQFIYVGRLEYKGQKDISELFKALSKLNNDNWKLRIYGTGPDKHKLISLSKKLNIFHNIEWMGFINNPLDHVKEADALILTSAYEGFPMVIAEALARGLYVISSNCPSGPSELINSDNGNLYKPNDIHQLSTLIDNVLDRNKMLNQLKIRNSISRFYVDSYFSNFVKYINKLSRNRYDK